VAPAASAVPHGGALLDASDVWLGALSGDAPRRALRRGVAAVCAAYPALGHGVRAWKQRLRGEPGPHHGMVAPRPWFDPRLAEPPRAVSATSLQALGACPHRYLLRYVLRVRPPDEPELAVDQWLSPRERGSLLHGVFEVAVRQAVDGGVGCDDVAFRDVALEVLDAHVAALREVLPPPGESVYALECEGLRLDVMAFASMIREDAPSVLAVEHAFGRGVVAPVPIGLPDGSTLQLAGAIDRVDQEEGGQLVIVDYKTGSSFRFGGRTGVLDGGRRLQHVLYAAAAEVLFGRPVARAEFHFPTRRSENHRARYDARAMQDGLGVVTELLAVARSGWFIPTNEPEDCKFCDYAAACRARVDPYGKVTSPLAEWSRELEHEAADALRRVRR
jgi:hypothetical protein